MKKLLLVFLLLLVFTNVAPTHPHAQGLLGDVLGLDEIAEDVIAEAKTALEGLLKEAKINGDSLLMHSATELQILIETSGWVLGSQLEKTVRELSAESQNLLAAIRNTTRDIAGLESVAYDLKDTLVLDLENVLRGVPFAEDRFWVQRVSGITQVVKESGSYRIGIKGVGLGIPSDDLKSTLSLRLNGEPLTPESATAVDPHETTFLIKNSDLTTLFTDDEMVLAELTFDIEQSRRKGWWLFKQWHTDTYSIPIKLALYPKNAGTVEVTVETPVYGFEKARDTDVAFLSPSSVGQRREDKLTLAVTGGQSVLVAGSKYLADPRLMCETQSHDQTILNRQHIPGINIPGGITGGVIDFPDISIPDQYRFLNQKGEVVTEIFQKVPPGWRDIGNNQVTNDINGDGFAEGTGCGDGWEVTNQVTSQDSTRIEWTVAFWTVPLQFRLIADEMEYRPLKDQKDSTTQTYTFQYSKPLLFDVPAGAATPKLKVTYKTRQVVDFLATENSPDNIWQALGTETFGNNKRYKYQVGQP